MKKITIIITIFLFLLLSYKLFLYIIEGTKFDNPKVFYIEDPDAIYIVTTNPTAGYYFLEGNNSFPDRGNFRIIITSSKLNLESYINKKVKIEGQIQKVSTKNIVCRSGWEKWCQKAAISNNYIPTVLIKKIKIL